jgi:ribonuclease E
MPKTQMLINYAPGDDCRIAIVEDGKLEEYSSESPKAISRVGNIYHGVVKNVEASIQAAFIDFGLEEHGFLHITDLHPSFFPGAAGDAGDAVGKKTPRRERPPIQECLKRGQKLMVQVLKEGVGTKGPTLTSYLSIPGRFLVMMPQMDKVGVSRKVEDDEQRRKMRDILDQLELPDGFGFILRTAGFERTKLELKRDLAYLQRLWKDMETRRRQGKAPRLLYSESDLLVRSLRDQLTSDITEIVIDDEGALERTARFLKILTPRSRPTLLRYTGPTPLFYAFGVEQQIVNIHSREVPLPSGGRLVIDETEALVAIDVNSGRSRRARDAETNAYQTNIEAVDEICRQLRLRDLGGLVINDLIDMRDRRRRREIEARFKERLRRDRAKSTILPISEFGILEMTRQRMRGSHESQHFIDCPTCHGRGLVQRPDSVAADALRSLAAIIGSDRVARVEMVVSPRVAGSLLSARRTTLGRIERSSGRQVDVRVSETVPLDRVAFFAYDAAGADVELDKLADARLPKPPVEEVSPGGESDWAVDPAEEQRAAPEPEPEADLAERELHPIELAADFEDEEAAEEAGARKKRKRRRRRKRKSEGAEEAVAASEESAAEVAAAEGYEGGDGDEEEAERPEARPAREAGERERPDAEDGEGAPKKKRRRRRRKRKTAGAAEGAEQAQPSAGVETGAGEEPAEPAEAIDEDAASPPEGEEPRDGEVRKKKKRRRRRKSGARAGEGAGGAEGEAADERPVSAEPPEPPEDRGTESRKGAEPSDEPAAKPARKKRSRRSAPKSTAAAEAKPGPSGGATEGQPVAPSKVAARSDKPAPGPRLLYTARRKLSPSERARIAEEG